MRFLLSLLLLLASSGAHACPTCRPKVLAGIYDGAWGVNATRLVLPLVLIGAISAGLYYAEPITARLRMGRNR